MFHTRLAALVAAVAIGALALPGVASANTGSVTCDSTGVVFHYNPNFSGTAVVTETVNGDTRQFTPPKGVTSTDTWPVFGTITAGATWNGGKIDTVTLQCAAPPRRPPRPAPAAAPAAGRASAARDTPAPPAPPPVVSTPVAPPAVVTVPPPVLSLHKKALATTVEAGAKVRYQLVVKATGGTAHGVVVCDKLPDHMTYVSLGTATLNNGKACWTVGDLTGSLTLSLTARVDADAPAGSLTNNATATSSNAGRAKAHATVKVPAKHGVKGKFKRTAGVTG